MAKRNQHLRNIIGLDCIDILCWPPQSNYLKNGVQTMRITMANYFRHRIIPYRIEKLILNTDTFRINTIIHDVDEICLIIRFFFSNSKFKWEFLSSLRINNQPVFGNLSLQERSAKMLKLTVYTLCLLALMGPTFAMNGKCPDFLEEACTNIHEKCAKETGVNEDLIVQAREAKFSEDEAFKNYLLCIFKSYNFIKDDKIDVETILKALPESVKDQYSPFIKECGFKDAGNIVDSVSATMKCYASTSPELFWVP